MERKKHGIRIGNGYDFTINCKSIDMRVCTVHRNRIITNKRIQATTTNLNKPTPKIRARKYKYNIYKHTHIYIYENITIRNSLQNANEQKQKRKKMNKKIHKSKNQNKIGLCKIINENETSKQHKNGKRKNKIYTPKFQYELQ